MASANAEGSRKASSVAGSRVTPSLAPTEPPEPQVQQQTRQARLGRGGCCRLTHGVRALGNG
eukprot:gene10415-34989_t